MGRFHGGGQGCAISGRGTLAPAEPADGTEARSGKRRGPCDGRPHGHDRLAADLRALTEADARARNARREADRQQTEAARAAARAEADRNLAEGRREAAELATARYRDDAATAAAALAEAKAARNSLEDLATLRAAAEAARAVTEAARTDLMKARAGADDLRRENGARDKRLAEIGREETGWQERLATAGTRGAELASRAARVSADLAEARARPADLARKAADLDQALADARRRKDRAEAGLREAETTLIEALTAERAAERGASDTREARARAEAQRDAMAEGVAQAEARLRESMDQAPATILAALEADPDAIPAIPALETEIAALRRQRDALGAVNLRAEEDAIEVQAEHDRLVTEKGRSGTGDPFTAWRHLGPEPRRARKAADRVRAGEQQFRPAVHPPFRRRRGAAGAGRIRRSAGGGAGIMAQPPGKKLSTLSLLSGGEQTLTALALIFGVFLTNPAPICVLDEVDAPLDDANVTRFCELLDEMTRRTETRFLIITHHAVTMARMDRLFGVTMAEQGVSQLVSVDLRKAAALVA